MNVCCLPTVLNCNLIRQQARWRVLEHSSSHVRVSWIGIVCLQSYSIKQPLLGLEERLGGRLCEVMWEMCHSHASQMQIVWMSLERWHNRQNCHFQCSLFLHSNKVIGNFINENHFLINCGQFYQFFTVFIYDTSIVQTWNLPRIRLYSRKLWS